MKHWKPILGATAIFLCGILVGGIATGVVIRKRIHAALTRGPEACIPLIVRRLDWQLHLSGSQHQQVEAIMRDTQGELREIRHKVQPDVVKTLAESRERVSKVLTPEQQAKYKALADRFRSRWERMD